MAWWEYPGTTKIRGAAFGNPTPAELNYAARIQTANTRAEARRSAARIGADVQEEAAWLRSPGALVPSGVPGQFRRVGSDVASRHLADAVTNGATLGTPESYKGGAGAPTPVGVIRGMKPAFATDTGGPQLSEFATPEQAMQASNRAGLREATVRAMDLPDEVPPGSPAGTPAPRQQALAEASARFGGYEAMPATARDTLSQAQAEALQQSIEQTKIATNRANFQQQALPALGVKNLDELKKDPGKYALFAQHLDIAGKEGPESALTKMQDTMNHNRWSQLFTPENIQAVHNAMAAQGIQAPPPSPEMLNTGDPALRDRLVRHYGPYFDKYVNQGGVLKQLFTTPSPF